MSHQSVGVGIRTAPKLGPLRPLGRVAALLVLGLLAPAAEQQQNRTKAAATSTIDAPFVLDETKLRRIVDVVRRRITDQAPGATIHITVTHADNTEYETESTDYVLHDINPDYNPIVALSILGLGPIPMDGLLGAKSEDEMRLAAERAFHEYLNDSQPKIEVSFRQERAEFKVSGKAVDWVFGTRTEIGNQVRSTTKLKVFRPKPQWTFGVVTLTTLALIVVFARNRYDRIRSADGQLKPTSLITYVNNVKDPFWQGTSRQLMTLILSFAFGVGFAYGYNEFVYHFFPRAVFLIGDQVAAYQDLVDIRSKVLWGIGIAFAISLGAGLIANSITNKRTRASVVAGVAR